MTRLTVFATVYLETLRCPLSQYLQSKTGPSKTKALYQVITVLSKATPGPQPGGEQTKISKIEFDPLGPSTMHVNTLRPGILVLSSFVWS